MARHRRSHPTPASERHRKEATRRAKIAARRYLANLGLQGATARFSYHSAGKNEVSVREIKVMTAQLRISSKGSAFIRAIDLQRGGWRSFTLTRIERATAA